MRALQTYEDPPSRRSFVFFSVAAERQIDKACWCRPQGNQARACLSSPRALVAAQQTPQPAIDKQPVAAREASSISHLSDDLRKKRISVRFSERNNRPRSSARPCASNQHFRLKQNAAQCLSVSGGGDFPPELAFLPPQAIVPRSQFPMPWV